MTESPQRRNIVICCDGTGNEYGENNTNVAKLFGLLIKDDREKQVGYYDPGVGTFSSPGAMTHTAKWFTKMIGLAFAYGLTANVEDAYRYLMNNFRDDDRLFLFGFSRGAFTVRALAGMLHRCGLLTKGSDNLVPYASRVYKGNKDKVAAGFKKTFSRECKPHFVGVWDTVKSVGLLRPRRFPNAKLNPDVLYGRHAIAVDEKRSQYRPNLWESPAPHQSIEQVWFPGVHSDVGGSYREAGLSNIALHWMAKEACSCGLLIDKTALSKFECNYDDKLHNPLLPLWWLLGWRKRKIPDGSSVHQSVDDRMNADETYRPKNITEAKDLEYVTTAECDTPERME